MASKVAATATLFARIRERCPYVSDELEVGFVLPTRPGGMRFHSAMPVAQLLGDPLTAQANLGRALRAVDTLPDARRPGVRTENDAINDQMVGLL